MKRLLLPVFALALAGLAPAELTLSLDAANGPNGLPRYFVSLPSVGTSTAIITGSLVGNIRDRVTGSDQLALTLGSNMKGTTFEYSDAINATLELNGSYTGPLFEYTFDTDDEAGVYLCEHFAFGSLFSSSDGATNGVEFEVVAQPVPEPATMMAIGLGAVGLLRRRRKA